MANVTLKRWNGTSWVEMLVTPAPHTHTTSNITNIASLPGLVHYVVGNTSGTDGTWTGTDSSITAYFEGLAIAYKIGINGAGTTTLNINGLGAILCRRTDGNLTTHLPIGTVVILTYTTQVINTVVTPVFVWADYDSDSNYDLRTTGYYLNGEDAVYAYKIVAEGANGKFYPLTLENNTGALKTVSTREFKVGGKILYSTQSVSANALTRYYWYDRIAQLSSYTFNQSSGFTQGLPVYMKGIIQANGSFKLDDSSKTAFITQTLPTTEDGFIYIKLGYMHDNTNINFDIQHEIYEYVNGKIVLYSVGTPIIRLT